METPYGPFHRFGMDDAATAGFLCEATAAGTLGDFTVAHFADNDYRSHEVGPHAALPVIETWTRPSARCSTRPAASIGCRELPGI